MKKILILLSLAAVTLAAQAQNPHLEYKHALKLYNLSSYEELVETTRWNDSSGYSTQTNSLAMQWLQPALAFQWKSKKNNFHEIELSNLTWGTEGKKTEILYDTTIRRQTINGATVTSTSIAARYEYIVMNSNEKSQKWVPSIGFGIQPYFRRNAYVPQLATSYQNREMRMGLRTFITPRLTYFLSSKLYIDLNIPICLLHGFVYSTNTENPSIPINQRTVTTYNLNPFAQAISGRIGIGVKL
jgi:hypothetical protein